MVRMFVCMCVLEGGKLSLELYVCVYWRGEG